jgi:hypothetical protein
MKTIIKVWVVFDGNNNADFDGTIYYDTTQSGAIDKFCYPALNWNAYIKDGYEAKLVNITFIERIENA